MRTVVAVLSAVVAIVATGLYVGVIHPRQVARANCEHQAQEFAGYDGLSYDVLFDTCMRGSAQVP
jgi:hypothetical protein